MADDGIRAKAPISAQPGTAFSTLFTVPAGKEWTIRLLRATNISSGGSSTAVVSVSVGASLIAANEVLPAPSASASGSKNILGPDFITLPPGSLIQARAGAADTVRLTAFITERDL